MRIGRFVALEAGWAGFVDAGTGGFTVADTVADLITGVVSLDIVVTAGFFAGGAEEERSPCPLRFASVDVAVLAFEEESDTFVSLVRPSDEGGRATGPFIEGLVSLFDTSEAVSVVFTSVFVA